MTPRSKALLLIVAMAMSLPAVAQAQTALNQVRLGNGQPVTDVGQRTITLTVADDVSVGDVVFIDQEAMVAQVVNTTTEVVTVARGALGTAAAQHLGNSIVWTGAANRFYFNDPKAGRCTPNSAYPGGYYPWINVLTGEAWECKDNLYGRANSVAGNWVSTTLYPYMPSVWPYTPIAYRTSRTADALVITPAYTVRLTDVLVASLTYSGVFEVFLHAPTGMLGKRVIVSDFARLNQGSPAGRTITIRGLFENGDNSVTLGRFEEPQAGGASGLTSLFIGVGASTSFYVGITASSMFYWFASPF